MKLETYIKTSHWWLRIRCCSSSDLKQSALNFQHTVTTTSQFTHLLKTNLFTLGWSCTILLASLTCYFADELRHHHINWPIHSFIYSFIHSLTNSFLPWFIHSFIPSFIHFFHSFLPSFIHSFIHCSFIDLLIDSFIHSVTHTFIHCCAVVNKPLRQCLCGAAEPWGISLSSLCEVKTFFSFGSPSEVAVDYISTVCQLFNSCPFFLRYYTTLQLTSLVLLLHDCCSCCYYYMTLWCIV